MKRGWVLCGNKTDRVKLAEQMLRKCFADAAEFVERLCLHFACDWLMFLGGFEGSSLVKECKMETFKITFCGQKDFTL